MTVQQHQTLLFVVVCLTSSLVIWAHARLLCS